MQHRTDFEITKETPNSELRKISSDHIEGWKQQIYSHKNYRYVACEVDLGRKQNKLYAALVNKRDALFMVHKCL
jgi:hypothetical protein